jgi:hypothetical protein
MHNRLLFVISSLLLLALACTFSPTVATQTPLIVVITAAAPSATTAPLPPTGTPEPTDTAAPSAPSPTPAAVEDAGAWASVLSLNVRQGPGTTFPIVASLPQGSAMTVLGKARGDEWVLVDTGSKQGWVAVMFIELADPSALISLPVKELLSGYIIQGKIADASGNPVSGIDFAVVDDNDNRTDANSLADGSFYAYLPVDAPSHWRVSWVGINCKSNIMDANCKYTGTITPEYIDVNLPSNPPLIFTYTK